MERLEQVACHHKNFSQQIKRAIMVVAAIAIFTAHSQKWCLLLIHKPTNKKSRRISLRTSPKLLQKQPRLPNRRKENPWWSLIGIHRRPNTTGEPNTRNHDTPTAITTNTIRWTQVYQWQNLRTSGLNRRNAMHSSTFSTWLSEWMPTLLCSKQPDSLKDSSSECFPVWNGSV